MLLEVEELVEEEATLSSHNIQPSTTFTASTVGEEQQDDFLSTEESELLDDQDSRTRKSVIPRLVDNKRKHLEKTLSAAQRDKMLLDKAKEDALFRKDIAKAMKESNKTFSESVEKLSASITAMSDGISRSMERIAQAMCSQARPPIPMQPINQNMFYSWFKYSLIYIFLNKMLKSANL